MCWMWSKIKKSQYDMPVYTCFVYRSVVGRIHTKVLVTWRAGKEGRAERGGEF